MNIRRHYRKTTIFLIHLLLALGLTIAVTPGFAAKLSGGANNELAWKFKYDGNDRITKVIDPAGRATRMQYSFDKDDRLRSLARTTADGSRVIQRFDEQGRRSSMQDKAGTVSYGYDDLGRLNRVKRKGSPAVTYTYDTLDRIKTLQVGDFYRIEYTYDFLGRLESMNTPAGVVQYDYLTGQGKVVRTLPNGVKTFSDYAPNGELRKITHGLFNKSSDTSYQVLAEYSYQYRPDGLIDAIQERSATGQFVRTYEYDKVGRLTQAIGSKGRRQTYEYDPVGNLLKTRSSLEPSQELTYDWAGRLTSLNGAPARHDAAGNLTALSVGGKTQRYRYNLENQLAEALGSKVRYRYDGEGNLIWRKASGTETTFIPNPLSSFWRPLIMEDNAGHRSLVIWDDSTPLMMIRDGKAKYLLHDHLGSVRLVVDGRGKVSRNFDYEPFGGIVDSAGAADFAPRFAGLFWDPVADVYLTLARAYSSVLGRFLQIDPLHRLPFGSQNDLGFFTYSGNDPINQLDRSGNVPQKFDVGGSISRWEQQRFLLRKSQALFPLSPTNPWRQGYTAQVSQAIGEEILGYAFKQSMTDASILGKLLREDLYALIKLRPPVLVDYGTPLINSSYTGFTQTLGSVTAGLESLQTIGQTQLASNPSLYLNDRYKWGWKGDGSFRTGNSTVNYHEVLKTGPNIYRSHISKIRTPQGNHVLTKISNTPSSSLMERIMMNAFPLGEYYEPGVTSEIRTRRSTAKYTETSPGKASPIPSATDIQRWDNYWTNKDYLHSPPPKLSYRNDRDDPGSRGSGGFSGQNSTGSSFHKISPSPVGGVYLGGASQALDAVGLIEGISLDANNNLILLSKTGEMIDLPPLRIDDVVTVFRSVYLHGEGPTVTIDPNPEDPEGSAMIVRHSKATENTYVGWVLFQADRLMKGYTLGVDNDTTKEVKSAVPGYDKVLNTIYFGGKSPEKLRKKGHWERFWIVPAEARRFSTSKTELTLFDVPLKLKTQSMKWKKGELVDDLKGKSSPGATAFTDWFTGKYDQIAEEQYLTPPPESGITKPVPVFTELRRIALITAIAEKLRNQGVPLPFWMRGYEIQPVPFEKFTPGLEVTRSNQRITARVYGGVQLSPADKDVRDFTPVSNLARLPKAEQRSVRKKIKLVAALEKAVQDEMTSIEPLKVQQFKHKGAGYQAVAIPGGDTQALASAILNEVDLAVTIEGGHSIQLARYYNSFFNPTGLWGKGWTLNLPHLEKTKVPTRRHGDEVSYKMAYELLTPLNSTYARFSRIKKVPMLNNSRLQVSDRPTDFFGLADGQPGFLSEPTLKLIRKDGGAWHFSKAGHLVAIEKSGFRTVYERDGGGRIARIVGLQGKRPVAYIDLKYDASGKLRSAKAKKAGSKSTETSIRYEYNNAGRLSGIVSTSGRLGYHYQGSWITAINYQAIDSKGKVAKEVALRSFKYNSRGQLLSEAAADGANTTYKVISDAKGSTVTVNQPGQTSGANSIRYDPSFRPIKANYADGTQASWSYPNAGGSVLDIKKRGGDTIRLTESADQRRRTLELDKKHKITSEFDTAGRMTSLSENGRTLMEQEWSPLGQLRVAKNETQAEHFEYDEDGLVSRVLQAPPGESGQFKHWQTTKIDPTGRPVEIKDYRGKHLSMSYGKDGELDGMVTHRDGKNYGFKVIRDKSSRIQEVQSPWGKQQYAYDTAGRVQKLKVDKGGASASAEWQSGLLRKVKQFDGGDLSLAYYEDKRRTGLPKQITTANRLVLSYEYDKSNRLREIGIGDSSRLELDFDGKGRISSWSYQPAN